MGKYEDHWRDLRTMLEARWTLLANRPTAAAEAEFGGTEPHADASADATAAAPCLVDLDP